MECKKAGHRIETIVSIILPSKGPLYAIEGGGGIGISHQDYHSILGKGIYVPLVSPFRYRLGSLTSSNTNNSVMRVLGCIYL